MSNSSEDPLLPLPISAQPPLAARLAAAEAALMLACATELEGNTSRREWLDRGLVEIANINAAMLAGTETISAQEAARLVKLQGLLATLQEQ